MSYTTLSLGRGGKSAPRIRSIRRTSSVSLVLVLLRLRAQASSRAGVGLAFGIMGRQEQATAVRD